MLSGFICGTSSLPNEEDDLCRQTRSANSSPRRHCRLISSSTKSGSKNPYSNRGLDKFSALLAEIEEKRQQIYSQVDPDEISLVRFVYSPDSNIKPIVVKVKPKSETPNRNPKTEIPKIESPLPDQNPNHGFLKKLSSSSGMEVKKEENRGEICRKKMGFYGKFGVYNWGDPRFYLPVAIILILGVLVFSGRAFAVVCTSVGWYAIPSITNNKGSSSSNLKRSFKKKVVRKEGTVSFKSCTETKSLH